MEPSVLGPTIEHRKFNFALNLSKHKLVSKRSNQLSISNIGSFAMNSSSKWVKSDYTMQHCYNPYLFSLVRAA